MSQFSDQAPGAVRRNRGDDGRLGGRVPLTEGVRVQGLPSPPPVTPEATKGARLLDALGVVTDAVDTVARFRGAQLDDLHARERGLGAEFAGEDAAAIAERIRSGDLVRLEDESTQDFVGRVIRDNSQGLGDAAQESYRRRLTPALTEAVIRQEAEIQTKSANESVRLLGEANTAAASSEEIEANLAAYRRVRPDATDAEMIDEVIVPGLDEAVAAADTERFERLAAFVPEDRAGLMLRLRRRLADQVSTTGGQLQADRDRIAIESLEELMVDGRYDGVEARANQLREDGASARAVRPFIDRARREIATSERESLLAAQEAAARDVGAELDRLEVDDSTIGEFSREAEGIASRYGEILPDFDADAVVRREAGLRLDRAGEAGDLDAINRISRFFERGDDEMQTAAMRARRVAESRNRERDRAAIQEATRRATQAAMAEFADQDAQAALDPSSPFSAFDVADRVVRVNGQPLTNANGNSITLSAEDVKAETVRRFKSRLQERFPSDPIAREDALLPLLRSGYKDPDLVATLGGGVRLSGTDTAASIPPGVTEGYETYKRLRAKEPDVLTTHLPSGPSGDLFQMAFNYERLTGMETPAALVQARRALDRAAGGNTGPVAVGLGEAEETIEKAYGDDLLNVSAAANQLRLIQGLYADMGRERSLDAALETMKDRFKVLDGHLHLVADVPIPPNFDEVARLIKTVWASSPESERAYDFEDVRLRADPSRPDFFELVGPMNDLVVEAEGYSIAEINLIASAMAAKKRVSAIDEARLRDTRARERRARSQRLVGVGNLALIAGQIPAGDAPPVAPEPFVVPNLSSRAVSPPEARPPFEIPAGTRPFVRDTLERILERDIEDLFEDPTPEVPFTDEDFILIYGGP